MLGKARAHVFRREVTSNVALALALLIYQLIPKAPDALNNLSVGFSFLGLSGQNSFFAAAAQPVPGEEKSVVFDLLTHQTAHSATTILASNSRHLANVCFYLTSSASLSACFRSDRLNHWVSERQGRVVFPLTSFCKGDSPVIPKNHKYKL